MKVLEIKMKVRNAHNGEGQLPKQRVPTRSYRINGTVSSM